MGDEATVYKVDMLARVEGEGRFTLRVRDGAVEEASFSIFEAPRFFEAFLRGRSIYEVADIVARICGICPVAYQMSGLRAIEDVLGMPRMPAFVDEQERRYPTRILAARAAYMEGVPLNRILQVLSSSLRYDGDPGVEWWVKLMRNKSLASPGSKADTARAIKRVALGTGKGTPRPRVKAPKHK